MSGWGEQMDDQPRRYVPPNLRGMGAPAPPPGPMGAGPVMPGAYGAPQGAYGAPQGQPGGYGRPGGFGGGEHSHCGCMRKIGQFHARQQFVLTWTGPRAA
jgi:hypothetical protein